MCLKFLLSSLKKGVPSLYSKGLVLMPEKLRLATVIKFCLRQPWPIVILIL